MIKKSLETIGIQFKSQLDKNDINFWWQKKYTEILKSDLENKNELLISLNNALENLEKIDIKTIKSQLKNEPSEIKNTQKMKEVAKNNTQSNQDKFFNTPEEFGKEEKSKIYRELGVNNNKTNKDNLTSNILAEVSSNRNEENFKNVKANKYKKNPSIRNRLFLESKKTINNFFIIFSIISSLVLFNIGLHIVFGNFFSLEGRKSYSFYKEDKKGLESKKSNKNIIKIEPRSMDDENNKLKRINLPKEKVQKNLNIKSFPEKFKRKNTKYTNPLLGTSEDIFFYFNRALENERLGRYREAIADYDLIAQIKKSEMDYHYENALFYRAWLKIKNKKNHKGAIEDMEKLIVMNPNNIDLKIDLAHFLYYNNKNKKAVQILEKAIKENPNEGNLYYWKGFYKNEYSYPTGCKYIRKSKKLKASDWYPFPGPC